MKKVAFAEWLQAQMDVRSWKKADLARASNVSSAQISNILNGMRDVGPETCRALAKALELPQRVVFIKAGLMDDDESFPVAKNKLLAELLQEASQLDDIDILTMTDQIRYVWAKRAQRLRERKEQDQQGAIDRNVK